MAAVTPDIAKARRLVVKIGSALLVGDEGLRADWLRGLCEDVALWRQRGSDVGDVVLTLEDPTYGTSTDVLNLGGNVEGTTTG